MVLEKTLESSLDSKEIQPVHPKDQSWILIGRTDAEAETVILWPLDAKNWLILKDPDAGKDWRQEEKGTTEDGWVASLTQWTWVWTSSGSWWWTAKPGLLQSMGSKRVRHNQEAELSLDSTLRVIRPAFSMFYVPVSKISGVAAYSLNMYSFLDYDPAYFSSVLL